MYLCERAHMYGTYITFSITYSATNFATYNNWITF